VVDQDRFRVWAARLAAPAAFFAAALVLVWLVSSAISSSSSGDSNGSNSTLPTTNEPGTTTAAKPTKKRFYRVRSGDTLESIAAKFETTVDDLLRLNPGIDPLALSPRQRIRVN
jgi:LysM repeat protein